MSFSYHLHCVVIFILNQRKDYYRTSDRSSSYILVLIAFNLSYHSLPKCAVYSRIYVRNHCYPNTSKTYIVAAVNINFEGRKLGAFCGDNRWEPWNPIHQGPCKAS